MKEIEIPAAAGAPEPKLPYMILRALLWTALAASAAIFLGEYLINRLYLGKSGFFIASWIALLGNIVILFCFLLIWLALFNRVITSILVGLSLYAVVILSDILKLVHFDNPVRPTDLQYLADLEVVAKSFTSAKSVLIIVAIALGLIALIIALWRKESPALKPGARLYAGLLASLLLIILFMLPSYYPAREWLNQQGVELPESWQFEPRASAQMNGLLMDWAMSAVDLSFREPERYNRSEIERIAHAIEKQSKTPSVPKTERPPNLILFIVESFMDPLELGLHFTADPIPTFHAIRRTSSGGKVVVPVFGGTSANTEFELLTGLSMYFLPDASCPYRQYLTQDIPSLPRMLHHYGYRTIAIPADPPYLFNRRAAFRHLGFDRWMFPEADPKTPRTPDDEFASDGAIVDAVIGSSRGETPFFAMAFTGGTHYPWEYPDYRNSALDFTDSMAEPDRSRLKTYINALRVADAALNKLISYFEKIDQRTVILILGDHLPALAGIYDSLHFFKSAELGAAMKRYQVPAILWSNFPLARQEFVCSANFIPLRLLHVLGLHPLGSLALSAEVYSRFPVFSKYVQTADGRLFAPQSQNLPFPQLIEDYRLIEYDLLLGKQYASGIPGWDGMQPEKQ
jgi:hypothetical protein